MGFAKPSNPWVNPKAKKAFCPEAKIGARPRREIQKFHRLHSSARPTKQQGIWIWSVWLARTLETHNSQLTSPLPFHQITSPAFVLHRRSEPWLPYPWGKSKKIVGPIRPCPSAQRSEHMSWRFVAYKKKALKRREISTRRNRRTVKMSMARCLPYSIKKGWRLGVAPYFYIKSRHMRKVSLMWRKKKGYETNIFETRWVNTALWNSFGIKNNVKF